MRRVFKARHFDRWMRKAGLTDRLLCAAFAEMVAGLIDADLGGHVVKKELRCLGAASLAAHERWSQQTAAVDGFSSLILRRTSETISVRLNLRHCKSWRTTI
ncbi:hypothetical protein PT2222_540001 [Paraburkholderia tropica]